jgi:hypothetical protein
VLQWLGQSKVKDKHIKKQRTVRVQVVSPPLYSKKKIKKNLAPWITLVRWWFLDGDGSLYQVDDID